MRGNARALLTGVLSAGVASVVGLGVAPTAGAAQASTARASVGAPAGGRVPVIVFLKNQPEASGASRVRSEKSALIQAAQAPYLQQLRQLGATSVKSYRLVDAFAATVPATAVRQLAASPGVARVIPDSPIAGPDPWRCTPTAPASPARRRRSRRAAAPASPRRWSRARRRW